MIYLIGFIVMLAAEWGYLQVARRVSWLHTAPGERSSHDVSTVTGAGFVIAAAAIAGLLTDNPREWLQAAGILLIAGVSFADDCRPLGILPRLLCQCLAAVAVMWGAVPPVIIIVLLPLSLAYINAYNFMDGINGMTVFYSAVLISVLLLLNGIYNFCNPLLPGLLLCAVAAVGVFNCRERALCFPGDTGAISAGVITLYMITRLISVTGNVWWIVLAGVYGVDTALTIFRRARLGEPIHLPHRRHLYQILCNERHLPHTLVAASYAGVQLVIDAGAIMLRDYLQYYTPAVIIVLIAAYAVILRSGKR